MLASHKLNPKITWKLNQAVAISALSYYYCNFVCLSFYCSIINTIISITEWHLKGPFSGTIFTQTEKIHEVVGF